MRERHLWNNWTKLKNPAVSFQRTLCVCVRSQSQSRCGILTKPRLRRLDLLSLSVRSRRLLVAVVRGHLIRVWAGPGSRGRGGEAGDSIWRNYLPSLFLLMSPFEPLENILDCFHCFNSNTHRFSISNVIWTSSLCRRLPLWGVLIGWGWHESASQLFH